MISEKSVCIFSAKVGTSSKVNKDVEYSKTSCEFLQNARCKAFIPSFEKIYQFNANLFISMVSKVFLKGVRCIEIDLMFIKVLAYTSNIIVHLKVSYL